MKGNIAGFVTLVLILMCATEIEMMSEGMKQLTGGFLKVLEVCKTELGLSDGVLSDLYHLWKEEFDQLSRDAGCMISCMSKKLDLLDEDGKVHHGNTKEFVLKHGGGDDVAHQLATLAHECEKKYEHIAVECERVLEMAKCFRTDVKQVQWTPKMEVVMTELIAEV